MVAVVLTMLVVGLSPLSMQVVMVMATMLAVGDTGGGGCIDDGGGLLLLLTLMVGPSSQVAC